MDMQEGPPKFGIPCFGMSFVCMWRLHATTTAVTYVCITGDTGIVFVPVCCVFTYSNITVM
jgi:hypothetical protein